MSLKWNNVYISIKTIKLQYYVARNDILVSMIVGIDEVGRGCWAGPLVAGAVLLESEIPGLRDSKKLTKRQREAMSQLVKGSDAIYGLGWVSPAEVDELGLTAAVRIAMERALACITIPFNEVIIDGNFNFLAHMPLTRAIVQADNTVPAVSAASILAKVARDDYMIAQAEKFPGYGFEKHVGYGTAAHAAAMRELGLTPLHRKSYKPVRAVTMNAT